MILKSFVTIDSNDVINAIDKVETDVFRKIYNSEAIWVVCILIYLSIL